MKNNRIALCDSFSCNGKHVYSYKAMKIIDVREGIKFCPYCSSALLWKIPQCTRKPVRQPSNTRVKKVYEI